MKKWEKVGEESVIVGRRKLKKLQLKKPDGTNTEFTIYDEANTVCALVLTKEETVILARQYRVGPDEVLDELPGGMIDEGESPEHAITRELAEEIGYQGQIIFLGESIDSGYTTRHRFHFLVIGAEKEKKLHTDPDEHIEIVEKPLSLFLEQLKEGKMSDSETALRALRYLGK